jgi:hypothetical protein
MPHYHYRSSSPDCRSLSPYCLIRAYDFFRQRWRFLGHLPELFSNVSCISTSSTLYLFGGQLRSGELSDRIWILSLATLKWQLLAIRLPQPRGQHACVLFHNVVLLFFGISPPSVTSVSSNPCRSVDMFDLTSEKWTCLGESVPSYQCEPIVATGQWLLLSNRNDTQMLHTYKLRMQEQTDPMNNNGQAVKMATSFDDLSSSVSVTLKDATSLSRVSRIDLYLCCSIESTKKTNEMNTFVSCL